jgi:hypothetical protein
MLRRRNRQQSAASARSDEVASSTVTFDQIPLMAEPMIICPHCNGEIELTESLTAPLLEATKRQYEALLAQNNLEIATREQSVREREEKVRKSQSELDQQMEGIRAERVKIAADEVDKARRIVGTELDQREQEVSELQAVLKQRDRKLAEAQRAQAELMRRQRGLEDAKREFDLSVERKVRTSLADEREKAKSDVQAEMNVQVREREEQIASMQRQIEDLRRKSQQGSQQLQGEAQELEIETQLRAKFPYDAIEPVPKGRFGGDILHSIMGPTNQHCGTILWECKRTKNWSDAWLAKLRDDQRRAEADIAVVVTSTLPRGTNTFDYIDGVWVAATRFAIPVSIALRQSLIQIAAIRQSREGQDIKTELVYQYLTSSRFRQRMEAIVERLSDMQSDLDRERRAITKLWAKREAQIRGAIDATAGIYGDLQGIAGKALTEIEGLGLPLLELSDAAGESCDSSAFIETPDLTTAGPKTQR